jgi:hypothetical protein
MRNTSLPGHILAENVEQIPYHFLKTLIQDEKSRRRSGQLGGCKAARQFSLEWIVDQPVRASGVSVRFTQTLR